MLLKRQEEGNLIKATYDSTNILESTYNTTTKELIISFKTAQYSYPDINQTVYSIFEKAESQGKIFNASMRNLPFKKVADPASELKLSSPEDEPKTEG